MFGLTSNLLKVILNPKFQQNKDESPLSLLCLVISAF